jgi:hypothetical protein
MWRRLLLLLACGVLVASAGCSSGRPTIPPATVPATSAAAVCSALVNQSLLSRAERDFTADPSLAGQLAIVEQAAPTEMRAPFDNIIAALRSGDGLDVVGPDVRLLAGECRSRDLPIPVVT